jgi:hypothetical protein
VPRQRGEAQSARNIPARNYLVAPHRIWTFKLPNGPEVHGETQDIVGLYVPARLQALDRTQPELPMKPGRTPMGGLRPPCSGSASPEHPPAATSRRSLMSIEPDHFKWRRIKSEKDRTYISEPDRSCVLGGAI